MLVWLRCTAGLTPAPEAAAAVQVGRGTRLEHALLERISGTNAVPRVVEHRFSAAVRRVAPREPKADGLPAVGRHTRHGASALLLVQRSRW
jgi:hypothetical protein